MRSRSRISPVGINRVGADRITRRRFLKMGGAGLAGATLLGTAGCGVFEQGGGQQGGGPGGQNNESVNITLRDAIRDLNSTTTTDSVSTDVLQNVMEGLYRLDENTEPEPGMAEGYEVSSDQLTYTFTLRDGIRWSNGDPVTAQDFEYAWFRAIDPETAGQYAFIIAQFVRGATEFNAGEGSREDVAIEAVDDKTLRTTLVSPTPFFLGLTSFFTYLPQNQRFTEQQGDQYAQSADALLYNGPYTLGEFNPTQGVAFVKNDGYWDAENVDVESVDARIVKEQDTRVNLYESGELDVIEIDSQYVDEYRGSPEFDVRTTFSCFYMVFNYAEEFFRNENIRRAFQIGYDRDALVNEILNDGSGVAPGYVPTGIAGPDGQTFREAQGAVQPEFDAQEARGLFQQGVEEVGENPTIELLSYDESTARDVATFLQSQFQENLGANITVNVQPFDRKLELEENGEYQLSWQAWFADYNDPMTYMDLWLSDGSFNTQNYSNDRYDQLITDAQQEADEARRMDLLLEAERLLVEEDAACAPMFYEGVPRLQRPFINNYTYQPYGGGLALKPWTVEG